MDNKKEKMTELIKELNYHTKLYDEGHPVLTDKVWDDMFFELVKEEERLGFAEKNSPTQRVNWEAVSSLNKVKHNHLMLSLDKTKDIEEVKSFIGDKDFIAMTKLDGLTCSLHYINGHLVSAETRGNGEIGEDITHNAKVNSTIPLHISYRDELIIDGEVICDKNAFYPFDEKNGGDYKNPRNFASGKIRSLNPEDSEPLSLSFVAWDVIKGFDECSKLSGKLTELLNYGFLVTPYTIVHSIEDSIAFIQDAADKNAYPIDGVVFKFNDIKYYQSLGRTEHHFKGGLAYKFYDEEYETELLDIEWSMGRMGALTPIAIFKPIDIDGTIVSRASLHNISIAHKILGGHDFGWKEQKIWVSKRNMIIPQVEKAEEDNDLTKYYFNLPSVCPICGGNVEVRKEIDSKMLYCANPNCEGKIVNKIDHFCSKKGLDIKGLSKATLEKLLDWGLVEDIDDIYTLCDKRDEWINKPGFGVKSVDKILNAIEESRNCNLIDFIAAIGIPLIGKAVAKQLVQYIDSYEDFRNKIDNSYDFTIIEGFGQAMSNAICDFDYALADRLVKYHLNATKTIEEEKTQDLEGKTFVVTGKLKTFKNRDELSAAIAARGGKVASSISGKTDYLINNDTTSTSAKNKKAKELEIPIISEEEFLKL